MSKLPKQGKLLGIDLGRRVTGIAITDAGQQVVFARPEVTHISDEELLAALTAFAQAEAAVGAVVGLPLGWEGKDTDQTRWVRQIVEQLEASLPVKLMDESFSSQLANAESEHKLQRRDSEVARSLLLQHLDAR